MNCCISTVNISIIVNGTLSKEFSTCKGLRQGCPLSPLLFNIIGEALNAVLKKAVEVNFFEGLQIIRNDRAISHI